MLIVPASLVMVAATGFDGLCRTAVICHASDVLGIINYFSSTIQTVGLLVEETHNIVVKKGLQVVK